MRFPAPKYRWPLVVLAGVGILELTLRLTAPLGDSRIVRDPKLLYRVRPFSVAYSRDLDNGKRFETHYDARGMRETSLSKSESDRPRVVVYGDSFVEGLYSDTPYTFTRLLENHLREKGLAKAAVWNAGVMGYGPDQELARMQNEIGEVKPDLVVWCLFAGNDYGDLLRNRMVAVGQNESLQWLTPSLSPRLEVDLKPKSSLVYRSEIAKRFLNYLPILRMKVAQLAQKNDLLPRKSALASGIEYNLASNRREFYEYRKNLPVDNVFGDYFDFDLLVQNDSYQTQKKRQLLGAVLREAKKTIASQVPLLVVIIPLREAATLDCRTLSNEAPGQETCSPRAQTDIAANLAVQSGLPFLDLFDAFKNSTNPLGNYLSFDGHWSHAGQALSAHLVGEAVIQIHNASSH